MCYYCGDAVPEEPKPGFSEICPRCGKDMHVCLMCRFYSPGLHWDCRETVDVHVLEKDRRNFCEWFALDPAFAVKTAGLGKPRDAAETARTAFEALFRK